MSAGPHPDVGGVVFNFTKHVRVKGELDTSIGGSMRLL
jgi:hypothetical protein